MKSLRRVVSTAAEIGARDSAPLRSLEAEIGQQVRGLRQSLGLTVAELGSAARVSKGMLSKIENGAISPSLETLSGLAKALNVSIQDLFRTADDEPNCSFVKAGTGTRMNRRGTKVGHHYDLLVSQSLKGNTGIEPYLITLDQHSVAHTTFRHGGHEFIFVLTGTLKYRHGDKSYLLERGDTLCFDASVRHGPEQLISAPITYLSIVSFPRRD